MTNLNALLQQIQMQYKANRDPKRDDDDLVFVAIRKRQLRRLVPSLGLPKSYEEYDYITATRMEHQLRNQQDVIGRLPKGLTYGAEFIAELGRTNCCIHKSRFGPIYGKILPEEFLYHIAELFRLVHGCDLTEVNDRGKDL